MGKLWELLVVVFDLAVIASVTISFVSLEFRSISSFVNASGDLQLQKLVGIVLPLLRPNRV
jgi:hypothetical protein